MLPIPDCTIIIPVTRADDPDIDSRITLRLHIRCLSDKSVFLRGLFSGISPLHLVRVLSASRLHPSIPLQPPPGRLPHLLYSAPSHPVLFLPVPDPFSIQPLFHWMYSDNTDHIESALDQGLIHWEGLVRNVEYLCLSTDIKVFLGRWYHNWLLTTQSSPPCTPLPADEDDQSDIDSDGCDDSACNDYFSDPSTDNEIQSDDDECNRGRSRDVKPLVQTCGQLRLCTA